MPPGAGYWVRGRAQSSRVAYRVVSMHASLRWLALTFFAVAALCPASALAVEHDPRLWVQLTANVELGKGWLGYGELQPRFVLDAPALQSNILRFAFGRQLTRQWSFFVGYAWTPLVEPRYTDEQRPFLQNVVNHEWGRVQFVERTRFEGRFLSDAAGPAFRLRHMFRAVLPLGDGGPWSLVGYDELFANLNGVSGGPSAGLDQNRLFGGVQYRFSPVFFLEGGYIFNYVWRRDAPENAVHHNALLWASWNF